MKSILLLVHRRTQLKANLNKRCVNCGNHCVAVNIIKNDAINCQRNVWSNNFMCDSTVIVYYVT